MSTIVVSVDPVETAEMVTGVEPSMAEERCSVSIEFCAKALPDARISVHAIRVPRCLLFAVDRAVGEDAIVAVFRSIQM